METSGQVLVLGAGGFLGAHLVRASGVVGVARGSDGFDAREPASLRALLERARPAAVVNAVALSRVGDCHADPEGARALNEGFPARLAEESARRGVRLVHVSTDLVFGAAPPPPGGFTERDAPGPLSVYGHTKLAGERRVLAAAPGALVVRLPLLYGASGGRGIGATDAILATLATGRRPRLFVDEWRTPLDVADAAGALLELARGAQRGLLHVGGPRRLSRFELGCALLEARGELDPERALERASRLDLDAPEPRPADVSLSSERARALLAAPLRPPAEALRSP